MSTWGGQLKELATRSQQGGFPAGMSVFDVLRRETLSRLHALTGRSTILYASAWVKGGHEPSSVSITPEDVQGLMEVVHGLPGPALDLILWLPGGSPEAAEYVVNYLRTKFTDVRAIVPHAAMSAATMIACAANRIVMGKHSALGPIDPQFPIRTELGPALVPGYAIVQQFRMAQREILANPGAIQVWLPLLRQYGPALLVQCEFADKLGQSLVAQWLRKYMLNGEPKADETAAKIAGALASHDDFKSHSRFIDRQHARDLGLVIEDLEGVGDAGQAFQDAVLSVFHATSHTFSATAAAKILENHNGKAFIKMSPQRQQLVVQPAPTAPPTPPPPAAP